MREQKKTSPFHSGAAFHLLKTHSFPLAGSPECDIQAAAKDCSRAGMTSKKPAPQEAVVGLGFAKLKLVRDNTKSCGHRLHTQSSAEGMTTSHREDQPGL